MVAIFSPEFRKHKVAPFEIVPRDYRIGQDHMWDRHPVRLALLHMLPAVAEKRSLRLGPLLAGAGLPGTLAEDAVVPRAQICALLRGVARKAGEPAIGIDLAAAADPGRLGMTGRALFAGHTLRECLVGHVAQMPGLQGGVAYSLTRREQRACLTHTLANSDPAHAQVLNEGIASFLVFALRAIGGDVEGGIHVCLPHRAEARSGIYEDALRADVSFGLRHGVEIWFDSAWLDRANPLFAQAGPDLPAETPPEARLGDAALLASIQRILNSASLAGGPSLVDTARKLGIAPRSLQRRLSGLDTSFEMLLDDWRRARAHDLLAHSAEPVGSIARALGYGHAAHFTRAFRRWENATPVAFRRASVARNGS